MKKVLSFCLALIMCVGMAGCGEKQLNIKEIVEDAGYEFSEDSGIYKIMENKETNQIPEEFQISFTEIAGEFNFSVISLRLYYTSDGMDGDFVNVIYDNENDEASTNYNGGRTVCEYYFDDESGFGCVETEIEYIKKAKKYYNKVLEKLDMNFEELRNEIKQYHEEINE